MRNLSQGKIVSLSFKFAICSIQKICVWSIAKCKIYVRYRIFTQDLAIQYYTLPLLSPPTVCRIGGKIWSPKHNCRDHRTQGTIALKSSWRGREATALIAETRGIAPSCEIEELNVWYRLFTRSSPIRLPVRERTYFGIEILLRGLFGSLRVDYAPQTPDQARGDYAPWDLTAKCDIETLTIVKILSQNPKMA